MKYVRRLLPVALSMATLAFCLSGFVSASFAADTQQIVTVAGIKFELLYCKMDGKTTTCEIFATSMGKDRDLTFGCGSQHIYGQLYADNGDSYNCSSSTIANSVGPNVKRKLVDGIRTPLKVLFENISASVRAVALLKMQFHVVNAGYKILDLRNIPVTE